MGARIRQNPGSKNYCLSSIDGTNTDINSLLVTDSEISDIVTRALQNQDLTATEERKYKAFEYSEDRGLAFLQYETGNH